MREVIRPHGNAIVFRKADRRGMIAVPDSVQESEVRAEILAVGPGRRLNDGTLDAPAFKVGDVVLYVGTAAPIRLEGEKSEVYVGDARYVVGTFGIEA